MTEIETRFDTRIDVGLDDEEDEFDLDLRLGELATWRSGHPTHLLGGTALVDAQTDGGGCLPTGGAGKGGTCNTGDNTCPDTCAGLATCPHTACNTCQATCAGHNTCPRTNCGATCGNTCPRTDCDTCVRTDCHCATEAQTHCFTCRSGCHGTGNVHCQEP